MTDLYFGIKLVIYAIVVGFFVICLLFLLFQGIKEQIRCNRINKYLTSIGFERGLIRTVAFGDNHTYGYIKEYENRYTVIIEDNELKNMPLREIKKRWK